MIASEERSEDREDDDGEDGDDGTGCDGMVVSSIFQQRMI